MADLGPAVSTVIRRCLGVKSGEDVLVVVHPGTLTIGERLRDEAAAGGPAAFRAVMDERPTDGPEPPPPIAAALLACDVYLAPTTRSVSHTTARKRATDAGIRGATMPEVNADMRARVMAVDFDAMAARSRAVAVLFDDASAAHVSCPLGTELTLDLTGRGGISDDGDLSSPSAFGNLPCGEAFVAPAGGEGVLFASSLARL